MEGVVYFIAPLVLNSISDIRMDIAVPHSTGNERALAVEECACPQGYRGPSCQVHMQISDVDQQKHNFSRIFC